MAGIAEFSPRHDLEPLPSRYAIGVAGQGGTSIGPEYVSIYQESPAFRRIFDEAEEILLTEMDGFSLQSLAFESDPDIKKEAQKKAEQTVFSHLLNTTIYCAKYAAFAQNYAGSQEAEFILPQSAGECAALFISGMADFKTTLLVAKKRGELTERAAQENPGRMVYVAGLHGGFDRLSEVCDEVNKGAWEKGIKGVVSVANRNAPDIQIYSGTDELVSEVTRILDKKVIDLPISIGSHCALMEPMVDTFEKYLLDLYRQGNFDIPSIPWILNGQVLEDPLSIIGAMAKSPARMVDYQGSVEVMARQGIGAMVEMTPNTRKREVVGRFAKNTMDNLGADFNLTVF